VLRRLNLAAKKIRHQPTKNTTLLSQPGWITDADIRKKKKQKGKKRYYY